MPGACRCVCAHVGARAHKLETRGLGLRKAKGRGREQTQGTAVGRGSPWERNSLKTGTPLKSPQSPQVWFEYLASSSSWKGRHVSATWPCQGRLRTRRTHKVWDISKEGLTQTRSLLRPPRRHTGLSVLEETPPPAHTGSATTGGGGCRSQHPLSTGPPSSPALWGGADLPTHLCPVHFLPSQEAVGLETPPAQPRGPPSPEGCCPGPT